MWLAVEHTVSFDGQRSTLLGYTMLSVTGIQVIVFSYPAFVILENYDLFQFQDSKEVFSGKIIPFAPPMSGGRQ